MPDKPRAVDFATATLDKLEKDHTQIEKGHCDLCDDMLLIREWDLAVRVGNSDGSHLKPRKWTVHYVDSVKDFHQDQRNFVRRFNLGMEG